MIAPVIRNKNDVPPIMPYNKQRTPNTANTKATKHIIADDSVITDKKPINTPFD